MSMDPRDDAGGVLSLVQRGFHSKPRCLLVNARFERDVALHPGTRSQKPGKGKSGSWLTAPEHVGALSAGARKHDGKRRLGLPSGGCIGYGFYLIAVAHTRD